MTITRVLRNILVILAVSGCILAISIVLGFVGNLIFDILGYTFVCIIFISLILVIGAFFAGLFGWLK